ncbi:MAG: haloacid dehalogenase-like hydrolase [Minisyncoccota bacterium]
MAPQYTVVFDFDGTLTPKSYVSLFNIVEKGVLSEDFLKEANILRSKYIPKAMNGTITHEEESAWLAENTNIFIKAKTTIDQIKNALKNIRLRNSVVDCMALLKYKRIPIAVISYGIRQFIEIVLQNNHALPFVDSIYATNLEIDKNTGTIIGYDPNTILLPHQKGIASLHFAGSVRVHSNKILAVGDSLVDSLLGSLKENRFGIAEDEKQLERIKSVMGDCAITQDFTPVITWLINKIDQNKSPA